MLLFSKPLALSSGVNWVTPHFMFRKICTRSHFTDPPEFLNVVLWDLVVYLFSPLGLAIEEERDAVAAAPAVAEKSAASSAW